ncbi:LOW QUALITY PROTEIN: CD166 antigen [Ciconia maguari]
MPASPAAQAPSPLPLAFTAPPVAQRAPGQRRIPRPAGAASPAARAAAARWGGGSGCPRGFPPPRCLRAVWRDGGGGGTGGRASAATAAGSASPAAALSPGAPLGCQREAATCSGAESLLAARREGEQPPPSAPGKLPLLPPPGDSCRRLPASEGEKSPPLRSAARGKSPRGRAAPLRRCLPVPPRAGGMMEPAAACASCRRRPLPPPLLLCLLLAALCLPPALGLYTVNAVYGDTITMPCRLEVPDGLMFGKWKYEMPNGSPVFIAFRSSTKKNVQYDDVPDYKDRLSLSENYTLSIKNARISDEKRFVCMLVTEDDVSEEPTIVKVFKQPSQPEILHQADFLETEKLQMLGECVARESYPEGNVTWYKNGRVLQPMEEVVVINSQKIVDKSTGLFTVTSSLQYMPTKEDANAKFSCIVTYYGPSGQKTIQSEPVVFDVHYPTEKVTIQVLSQTATVKEGDNITLKCSGNGNPPPQEFLFYIPGEAEGIRSSDTYIMTDVRRNATGEYKCSLTDKSMMDSTTITVHYLDLQLTPSGEVTKQIGEALPVSCTISSSRNATVFWIKDNTRMQTSPSFSSLQYQDAGNYICETTLQEVEGLKKRKTLKLIVEGKPQIKMTKKTNTNKMSKTIVCHVEGFPKPAVQWTVTGSGSIINKAKETKYVNGKFSSKIVIAPEENVTLTCIAENQLERTVTSLNVSAISIPEYDEPEDRNDDNSEKVNDQAKLIVGIVVGLLLAALVAGVVYWLYVKKSKTASKHVDKDLGNIEENKKLEENNHKSET